MNRTRFPLVAAVAVVVAAAVAVIVATGGASTAKPHPAVAAASAISLKQTSLGSTLVDPGQTSGQGLNQFGALWYVLAAGGNAVTSPSSSAAPTNGSGTSSYGY